MECILEGVIQSEHLDALENLLAGLTGVQKEGFRIHELCLKNKPNLGEIPSKVRILGDLEKPQPSWTVKHIGDEIKCAGVDQTSILVREMVESKTDKKVLPFFYAIGYMLDYELLKVGFAFHFQRDAEITVAVSSVNKMQKLYDTDGALPITPGMHLVEVSAPVTAENCAEVVSAVSSFCEPLASLLHLSKPTISTGLVPGAADAAAAIMSKGGETTS